MASRKSPTAHPSGPREPSGSAGSIDQAASAKRPWLRLGFAVLSTAGITWLLIHKLGGGAQFADAIDSMAPGWVGVAVLFAALGVALAVGRWQLIVWASGYHLPYGRGASGYLASLPFSVLTPSRASDLLRPLAVRDLMPVMVGVGVVVAERAIDLCVLLCLCAVGSLMLGLWPWAAVSFGLALAEVVILALLLAHRDWVSRIPVLRRHRGKIDDLFFTFQILRGSPRRVGWVVTSSVIIRLTTLGVIQALLVATHSQVSLLDTFGTWPIAMTAGLVPLTLAGMGTRDAAFVYLLLLAGVNTDGAEVISATLGYSVVAFWLPALAGLPFMLHELRRRRSAASAEKRVAP